MRCRECGKEVDNDKAFCPNCGAPMKVTADYDYIQAEIANKVDRFFYEDSEKENSDISSADSVSADRDAAENDPEVSDRSRSVSRTKNQRIQKRQHTVSDADFDDFAKTRNIYGNDSIFENDIPYDDRDEYDDYEEDRRQPVRRNSERSVRRPEPRRNDRPLNDADYYGTKDQTAAKILSVLIIFVIIAACAIGVMAITGVFRGSGNSSQKTSQTVSSLTSNVESGATYKSPVQITLNNVVEGNIFYTLDGSEPSIDSKMYTGPFTITPEDVASTYPTVNLRAVSFSAASAKSGDLNVTFNFEYNSAEVPVVPDNTTLSAPVITPEAGSYSSDTDITVSSPEGADIYYTYDGTTPTADSAKYEGPVKMIPGSSTFAAICVSGNTATDPVTASYDLEYNFDISSSAAIDAVRDNLLWVGYISDYDYNTYDGGHADVMHKGVYTIGDYTYYIVEADIYGADGSLSNVLYYGVGVNYGNVYEAGFDGSTYVVY